jgi:hypothetical protein
MLVQTLIADHILSLLVLTSSYNNNLLVCMLQPVPINSRAPVELLLQQLKGQTRKISPLVLVLFYNTLSTAVVMQLQERNYIMILNDKLGRMCGRKWLWPILKVLIQHLSTGTSEETSKTLSKNSQSIDKFQTMNTQQRIVTWCLIAYIKKIVLFGCGGEVKEENGLFSNKVLFQCFYRKTGRNWDKPRSGWEVPAKIQTRFLPVLYMFLFHTYIIDTIIS